MEISQNFVAFSEYINFKSSSLQIISWKQKVSTLNYDSVKFVLSKNATKFDKIFTLDLTLTTYCQIEGEDFIIIVAFLENTN